MFPWRHKTDCAYLLEALHGLVHQGRHLDLRALHLFLDLFVLAGVLLQGIQFSLQWVEVLLFFTHFLLDQGNRLQEFLWETSNTVRILTYNKYKYPRFSMVLLTYSGLLIYLFSNFYDSSSIFIICAFNLLIFQNYLNSIIICMHLDRIWNLRFHHGTFLTWQFLYIKLNISLFL